MRVLKSSRSFKKEFKRQLRFAITAAVGFSVAFAWREAVFDTFESFVSRALALPADHYTTAIYTALSITLAGVLLIFIFAKLLKN